MQLPELLKKIKNFRNSCPDNGLQGKSLLF